MMNRRRFLESASASLVVAPPIADSAHIVAAFRQGLKDAGFVEGQNVAIEYRFAEGRADRLPSLVDELVRRPVNVVFASGSHAGVM
jgi:putative tryptophan/tyrosine transport system substrate-binding protein